MVRSFRCPVVVFFELAVPVALLLSGCTQSTDEACRDLAAARCHHHATCSAALLAASFGDEATCRAHTFARCAALPALEGADLGADDIAACAEAYADHPCDALLLDAPPDACRFAGDKINGASCAADAQCQSSFCHAPEDGRCGTCAPVRKLGEMCSKGGSPCDVGLYCSAALTCTSPGEEADACSPTKPCGLRFSCVGGQCLPPALVGEPCDAEHTCDPLALLTCDPESQTCASREILGSQRHCAPAAPTEPCLADYPSCP